MLVKMCARCGAMVQYGKSYCEKCTPIVEEQKRKRLEERRKRNNATYNKKRDPKYASFYKSKAWREMSRAALIRDGYRCKECGAIATEVHHVIPVQRFDGWDRRLDFNNVVSLCTKCHNEAHERFREKRRKREKTIYSENA